MNSTKILGVRVDNVDLPSAIQKVEEFLTARAKQYTIFTPNPEMLVKARSDESFRQTLNQGDLNICDGFGLWLAASLRARNERRNPPVKMGRIPGVDFMVEICRLAEHRKLKIYLLGGKDEAACRQAADNLKKLFPNLNIIGFSHGPLVQETFGPCPTPSLLVKPDENNKTADKINSVQPDILFVAFGMGKQEKWILENLPRLPCIQIFMGVGGALDYLSGQIKRAPELMRQAGLEWLYRLYQEPHRLPRILSATLKFSWLALKEKL